MCGRFVLNATPDEIRELFGYTEETWFPARFNIAPTQPIGVVRQVAGQRHFSMMRWGLVPSWVKDPATYQLLINARAESLYERPAFRDAIRFRRCLVPASGFYEWKRGGKASRPFWLPPSAGGLVAFAGLYETWSDRDGRTIDSACIITVPANRETAAIHDRMPAVIRQDDHDKWLSSGELPPPVIESLLRPAADNFFAPVPVGTRVNAAANDGPDLILQVEEPPLEPETPSLFG